MAETASVPLRRAHLPDGRDLVVREVTQADLPSLRELYARLDDDARYRRFFTLYRPGERFFERLVSARQRGGACLVVEVSGGDVPPELAAEAGYEPLPNGDAELAITIDRRWRGWLGPYLLDALLEHAAAHGVPNLEADVLVTNRPMLSLLRSRRCATSPSAEWSVLRAVVGAGERLPGWPPQRSGRRVLVEGGSGRGLAGDEARQADLEVLACAGPGTCRAACPLLRGESCPLVDGADAIVMTRSTSGAVWDDIRAAHRRDHPEVPVVVESSRPRRGEPSLVDTVTQRLGT